jgi:MYXO-CTERM domain-containing protein
MLTILLGSFAFFSPVQAHGGAEFFEEVGEEVSTGIGGGWARVFPDRSGDGWHFLCAAGGDYALLPMSDELVVEDFGRTELTGFDYLIDHSITACPSGGYLHVASANLDEFNDSAYAFRYDDDFGLLSSLAIEERVGARKHNDLPLVCAPELNATAFGTSEGGDTVIVELDSNGAPTAEHSFAGMNTEGGTLIVEPETGDLLVFGMPHNGSDLNINRIDSDWNVTNTTTITLLDPNLRAYWPQSVLRIGDHYVLAFMARDEADGFGSDFGNVWLAVLNFELELEHLERVSNYDPSSGAMRPSLARKGDQMLLTVDRDVQPRIFPIELNSVAFGFDLNGDTGGLWDTGIESGSEGCGCSVTPKEPSYLWLGILAFAVLRRRQALFSFFGVCPTRM